PSRLWIDSPDDFGSASNRPDTGDAPLAARAASLSRKVVRPNEETSTLNEDLLASRTARILPWADAAGKVAGVNELQPLFGPDFGCADKHLRRSAVRISHLVIRVESSHVPGNVATYAG